MDYKKTFNYLKNKFFCRLILENYFLRVILVNEKFFIQQKIRLQTPIELVMPLLKSLKSFD